jgi:hypothetical protein
MAAVKTKSSPITCFCRFIAAVAVPFFWLFAAANLSFADDDDTASLSLDSIKSRLRERPDLPVSESVFHDFLASRQKLRTGLIEAVRNSSSENRNGERNSVVIFYRIAFDHDSSKLRYDFRYSDRPQGGGKYISTPEQSVLLSAEGRALTRSNPGDFPKTLPLQPFDVRAFGMVDPEAYFNSPYSFDKLVRAFREHQERAPLRLRNVELDGRVLLSCEISSEKSGSRHDFYLDANRGGGPVRWERFWAIADPELRRPSGVAEFDWQQINDVWVPVEARFVSSSDRRPAGDISLKWHSVNTALPEEFFDESDLGLPDDVWIMNNRLGKTVVEGTVGSLRERVIPESEPSSKKSKLWLLLANLGILFLLLAAYLARRWRTAQQPPGEQGRDQLN